MHIQTAKYPPLFMHVTISPSPSPSLLHLSVKIVFAGQPWAVNSFKYALVMLEVVLSCWCRKNPFKSQISHKEQQSLGDLSGQRSSSSAWEGAYPPFWLQQRAEECVEERECVAGWWVMALGTGSSVGGLRWTWSWARSPPGELWDGSRLIGRDHYPCAAVWGANPPYWTPSPSSGSSNAEPFWAAPLCQMSSSSGVYWEACRRHYLQGWAALPPAPSSWQRRRAHGVARQVEKEASPFPHALWHCRVESGPQTYCETASSPHGKNPPLETWRAGSGDPTTPRPLCRRCEPGKSYLKHRDKQRRVNLMFNLWSGEKLLPTIVILIVKYIYIYNNNTSFT